jgi:hypothetical protein
MWVSKEAEIYVDFKNVNLPKLQNAPKKIFSYVRMYKNIYSGIPFSGAFCH